MKSVMIHRLAGSFAENKDVARSIRTKKLMPSIESGEEVVIDFRDVRGTTQSFVHALISDVIRKHGPEALDLISFRNCNETVRKVISMVAEYMQESV